MVDFSDFCLYLYTIKLIEKVLKLPDCFLCMHDRIG